VSWKFLNNVTRSRFKASLAFLIIPVYIPKVESAALLLLITVLLLFAVKNVWLAAFLPSTAIESVIAAPSVLKFKSFWI